MFSQTIDHATELKILEREHAEELFSLTDRSRNTLREWLPWIDHTKTVEDSRKFIESGLIQWKEQNGFQAGIWHYGELTGVIGLHAIDWTHRSTSIGYWLGKTYEGKGLMTRSCKAVVKYCLEELDLNRIEIRAASENKRSIAIPKRLGFIQEGCIRQAEWLYDHYVDHLIFGLLKEDYIQLKARIYD